MAVTLYTSRIVLATLGIDDYGIYNVVGGVVTMFAFLNGTMSGVTQRFITYELGTGNIDKLRNVFTTAMGIHWIIASVIFLLAETIGLWFVHNKLVIPDERMVAAVWVYQFSVISTLILVVSIPYNACIIAHEKMSAFAYISILEVVLKLLIVIMLPFFGFDKLIIYGFFLFVIHFIIRIVYNEYCKRHFVETKKIGKIDKVLAKEMIGFTSWSLFGGLASVGMNQGLNILLNIFFGPAVNAARAVAVQVDTAIHSFVQNFQTAMKPQIVKSYASGSYSQMNSLVYASSKYSFYLLLALSLPFILETSFFLELWLKDVPKYTIPFLRLTLIVAILNTLATPLMTAANANGNIKNYQIICGSVQLFLIPLSYIALKLGAGPISVFLIYLVIIIVALFVRIIIVAKLVNISVKAYFWKVIAPISKVAIIAPIMPILFYFSLNEGLLRAIMVTVISILFVLFTSYYLGISNSERMFIGIQIDNLKKKCKL